MLALSPQPSSTGQSLTAPPSLENSFQPTGWVSPPWGTTHHRWWMNTRLGKASPCAWVEQLCAGLFTSSHSRWSELWEDWLRYHLALKRVWIHVYEMLTTGDQGESLWYDRACEMKDSNHMCWRGENLQDTSMMGEGGNQVQSTE